MTQNQNTNGSSNKNPLNESIIKGHVSPSGPVPQFVPPKPKPKPAN